MVNTLNTYIKITVEDKQPVLPLGDISKVAYIVTFDETPTNPDQVITITKDNIRTYISDINQIIKLEKVFTTGYLTEIDIISDEFTTFDYPRHKSLVMVDPTLDISSKVIKNKPLIFQEKSLLELFDDSFIPEPNYRYSPNKYFDVIFPSYVESIGSDFTKVSGTNLGIKNVEYANITDDEAEKLFKIGVCFLVRISNIVTLRDFYGADQLQGLAPYKEDYLAFRLQNIIFNDVMNQQTSFVTDATNLLITSAIREVLEDAKNNNIIASYNNEISLPNVANISLEDLVRGIISDAEITYTSIVELTKINVKMMRG
jgi:hypothetical protein